MNSLQSERRPNFSASGNQHDKAIFANAIDFAIIASNPAGLITDWNIGAERIFGWSAEEMIANRPNVFSRRKTARAVRSRTRCIKLWRLGVAATNAGI